MLGATFAYARLALGQVVLLNGAGATALLAFIPAHGAIAADLRCAVLLFAFGAGLGVVATVLAYFGQRVNWEAANATLTTKSGAATLIITAAMVAVAGALVLFVCGVAEAAAGI